MRSLSGEFSAAIDSLRTEIVELRALTEAMLDFPEEDVDALHAEFRASGVTIARGPCDQVYGCRDFEVDDCNGYRLWFGNCP